MKKSTFVLAAAVVVAGLGGRADGCSLVSINPQDVLGRMRPQVAVRLGLPLEQVPVHAFTRPKVTFLKPLGADCSGLDATFHSAGYHFTRHTPTRLCTHKGVVILKGYGLRGAIDVQDSSVCLGRPIVIDPRPRP